MIVILVEDYPSEKNKYAMSYTHSRNLEYLKSGLEVLVVSMRSQFNYSYEGIQVITKSEFKKVMRDKTLPEKKILISHAPNIKNHYGIIKDYEVFFVKILMFFHGHEALKVKNYYPSEYDYNKNSKKAFIHTFYDPIKLWLLKKIILNLHKKKKVLLIFVSEWMKKEALINLNLRINIDSEVINNNINIAFLENQYEPSKKFKGDFITIRPLDSSKYAIDLVVKLAEKNQKFTFHIYGIGKYFEYNHCPSNLFVFNDFIEQKDIPKLLNNYRIALMPTRLDAQGVMACEIATYGIPLITSNLTVCSEMFSEFQNVSLVNDNFFSEKINMREILENSKINKSNGKFSINNTVRKEIDIILKILN